MKAQFSHQKFFALLIAAVITMSGLAKSARAAVDTDPVEANATAAAPTNDNFANAKLLTGTSGGVGGTTVDATKEAGEPIHAFNKGGASVWYKYVASGNGVLSVETGGAASINSLLAVYTGGNLGSLQLIAADDDRRDSGGGSIYSSVYFGTQTGMTYYIAVDGKNKEMGTFSLFYSLFNAMPTDILASAANGGGLASALGPVDITTTNVGAGKEAGEPNHAGNAGGKSVWFRLSQNLGYNRTVTFSVTSRKVSNPAVGINALIAVYTGPDVAHLTPVASRQFNGFGTLTLPLAAFTTYHIALDGLDSGQGAETGNFTMVYGAARNDKLPDFDQDGLTDVTVFRPTTGTWYSQESATGNTRAMQFGANGDRPLIGDFDQDGKADYGVFRPDTGVWYLNNSTNGFQAFSWGLAGDIPLVRTVNVGNTRIEAPMVFRPTNGTWYTYALGAQPVTFGQLGDIPISEDFTGDGTDEFVVFRPSNGTWYLLDTVANQFRAVQFGATGDKPVAADFDGDGVTDLAVFRPSASTWYIINSHNNSFQAIQWGLPNDRPLVGNFTPDGKADVSVYRNGSWYIRDSFEETMIAVGFGNSTDIPLSSPQQ